MGLVSTLALKGKGRKIMKTEVREVYVDGAVVHVLKFLMRGQNFSCSIYKRENSSIYLIQLLHSYCVKSVGSV